MKPISTDAWHYKLVEYVYTREYFEHYSGRRKNVSLCRYFWSIVLGITLGWWLRWLAIHWPSFNIQPPKILKSILGAILLSIAAGVVVWLIIRAGIDGLIITGIVILCIAVTFGVTVGVLILKDWIGDRWNFKIGWPQRRKKPRETSSTVELMKEFIHSKKNRFCPTLQFKEEGVDSPPV